jgi:hypothetical protein
MRLLPRTLHRAEENAHRRSRDGVARPIFYKGEQVGEWRHHDERLTMFLLRCYRPERYGKALDRLLARREGEGEDGPEDPGITLDGGLSEIEFLAKDVPFDELHPQDCRDEADDDKPCAL